MTHAPAPAPITPPDAWKLLASGNARFVAGTPRHPHQSQWRRTDITGSQHPFATVLGCADSRVPPEILFDRGLGDIFTVRTAGHVLDSAVLGTLEYGVGVVGTPVLAVLGHENCGCVVAGVTTAQTGRRPGGHIDHLVDEVAASVEVCDETGTTCIGEVMEEHVRQTVRALMDRSPLIADAVRSGAVAIVGLTYRLSDGTVSLLDWIGELGRPHAAAAEATPQAQADRSHTAVVAQERAAASAAAAVAVSDPSDASEHEVVEAEEVTP